MKSKIFTLIIAMAMMLSFIGVASATDSCPYSCGCECDGGILECTCNEGLCPCNPIELLYVFADWDGWPFDTYPCLNIPGLHNYAINNTKYYINVTSMEGYEDGSYWSEPSAEFSAAASNDYEDFDIIFVDMVNMYMDEFETGADNAAADGKLLTAIRTGPNNNTCYMPLSFTIRDTPALSALSSEYDATFTTAFFDVHDNGPGATGTATTSDCEDMAEVLICYYLNLNC